MYGHNGNKNEQDTAKISDRTAIDAVIFFKKEKLSTSNNLSQGLQVALTGQKPFERVKQEADSYLSKLIRKG